MRFHSLSLHRYRRRTTSWLALQCGCQMELGIYTPRINCSDTATVDSCIQALADTVMHQPQLGLSPQIQQKWQEPQLAQQLLLPHHSVVPGRKDKGIKRNHNES